MRDDRESGWFSRWEQELPLPEELTPLSQSLISPNLALAFDIPSPQSQIPPQSAANSSAEFDSGGSGGGGGADEPARTLKRPRLVWTPQLHKRFVDAVAHLGIKNAVPKTIMQLMSVDGLTRENVASHLQKYRLYLKRMQGIPSGGGAHGSAAVSDPATDHLFASAPVPPHFLRPSSDHFLPFVAVEAGHHPMTVVPPPPPPQQHHHHHHHHHFRQYGNPANGQFEHPFVRHSPQGIQRMGPAATPIHSGNGSMAMQPSYAEDFNSGGTANGRKILTLFPTGDD